MLIIRARRKNAWHDLVEAGMCVVHQLHLLSNQIELFKWLTQLWRLLTVLQADGGTARGDGSQVKTSMLADAVQDMPACWS